MVGREGLIPGPAAELNTDQEQDQMGASDWWARRLSQPSGQPPPPAPQPQQYYAPAPGQPPPSPPHPEADTGDPYMSAIARAAAATGGSRQVQEESGVCPECGGGNFFDRKRNENGMPMRMPAAPHCYDCGYPLIQAGSSHGGLSTVRASGPAQKARQLPAGHAVTVVDGGRAVTYDPR